MTQKTKRDALIVLGLLGVFVALSPRFMEMLGLGGSGPSVVVPTAVVVTPQPLAQPEPPRVEAPLVRPHYTAEAQAMRDPTVSLLPAEPSAQDATASLSNASQRQTETPRFPALVVHGIVWGTARPQALMNGGLYEVGDVVEGARILAIQRSGVTIEVGGIRTVVRPASASTLAKRVVGEGDRWDSQPRR